MRVIAAAAAIQVEQTACDVGERQRAGVVVAQLVQTAAAAAVTERLPLVAVICSRSSSSRMRGRTFARRLPGASSGQGSPALPDASPTRPGKGVTARRRQARPHRSPASPTGRAGRPSGCPAIGRRLARRLLRPVQQHADLVPLTVTGRPSRGRTRNLFASGQRQQKQAVSHATHSDACGKLRQPQAMVAAAAALSRRRQALLLDRTARRLQLRRRTGGRRRLLVGQRGRRGRACLISAVP